MRKLLLGLLLISSFSGFSQTQGIAYTAVGKGVATTFVSDYHSLGINSSALGWRNEYGKRFTTGSSEFGFGVYSDSMNVDKLRDLFGAFRTQLSGGTNSEATREQQRQFARDFAGSNVAISANYNWFGFAFQHEKFGGIAVNVSENYQWNSTLGQRASDILFNGKFATLFDSLTVVYGSDTTRIANNESISEDTIAHVIAGTISSPLTLSYLTEGMRIRAQWTRNYNIGYGRRLFGRDSVVEIYAGIGGRYIQSIAMFDYSSDGSQVNLHSSVSPSFDINYGDYASQTGSFAGSNTGEFPPKAVGSGYGLDFSVSAILFNKLTIAAAVNNIGQIKYKRNVYSVRDTLIGSYSLEGLDNMNVTQSLNSLLSGGSIIRLEGEEEYVLTNAADFRFGASWKVNRFLHFGVDVVAPFDRENPGSIANPVYAFGGEVRPVKWLALSAGYFGGGVYKHNIPVGINFILGKGTYEFGVSSRDALSFFLDDSNSVSMAMGILRVRF